MFNTEMRWGGANSLMFQWGGGGGGDKQKLNILIKIGGGERRRGEQTTDRTDRQDRQTERTCNKSGAEERRPT